MFGVFRGSQIISVIRVFCGFKNFVFFRAIRGSLCIRFKLLALSFQLREAVCIRFKLLALSFQL